MIILMRLEPLINENLSLMISWSVNDHGLRYIFSVCILINCGEFLQALGDLESESNQQCQW